jgi:hypothetical protein
MPTFFQLPRGVKSCRLATIHLGERNSVVLGQEPQALPGTSKICHGLIVNMMMMSKICHRGNGAHYQEMPSRYGDTA